MTPMRLRFPLFVYIFNATNGRVMEYIIDCNIDILLIIVVKYTCFRRELRERHPKSAD